MQCSICSCYTVYFGDELRLYRSLKYRLPKYTVRALVVGVPVPVYRDSADSPQRPLSHSYTERRRRRRAPTALGRCYFGIRTQGGSERRVRETRDSAFKIEITPVRAFNLVPRTRLSQPQILLAVQHGPALLRQAVEHPYRCLLSILSRSYSA